MNKFQAGQSFEGYPGVAHLVAEVTLLYIEMKTRYLILKAADFINITGQKILVIGSLAPRVEAILLKSQEDCNPEVRTFINNSLPILQNLCRIVSI